MSKRLLLTEIGNNASGDEALYHATSRRLIAMGHTVNWVVRVPQPNLIETIGLPVTEHLLPVDPAPLDGIADAATLRKTFRAVDPEGWTRLQTLIADHDVLVVSAGGRYLDGYSIPRSTVAMAMAQDLGKPVVVLHQSLGPLVKSPDISLLSELLPRCEVIVTRDDLSLDVLSMLGVNKDRVIHSRDVIFAETYPRPGPATVDLGLNFRFGFNGHVNNDAVAGFLRAVRTTWPAWSILLYTTTHPLSSSVLNLARDFGCEVAPDLPLFPDYLDLPGRCRMNITDSFHGAIFSMLAGRPVLACQPDFGATKIHGSSVPGGKPWIPLPGLTDPDQIPVVMDGVQGIVHHFEETLTEQAAIAAYGTRSAEAGWDSLRGVLDRL